MHHRLEALAGRALAAGPGNFLRECFCIDDALANIADRLVFRLRCPQRPVKRSASFGWIDHFSIEQLIDGGLQLHVLCKGEQRRVCVGIEIVTRQIDVPARRREGFGGSPDAQYGAEGQGTQSLGMVMQCHWSALGQEQEKMVSASPAALRICVTGWALLRRSNTVRFLSPLIRSRM